MKKKPSFSFGGKINDITEFKDWLDNLDFIIQTQTRVAAKLREQAVKTKRANYIHISRISLRGDIISILDF